VKIYFLIAEYPELYDDGSITLAEGLREMGIEFYANRNYWKINNNGDYLFNFHNALDKNEFDVIILSDAWTQFIHHKTFKHYKGELPKWLFSSTRSYKTVYIDKMDGYKTFGYSEEARKFDYVLRCQKNKKTFNPNNIHPWALGYQDRILHERLNIPIEEKKLEIAVNFYFTHQFSHQTRAFAEKKILNKFKSIPINRFKNKKEEPQNAFSAMMWHQTLEKHNPGYYHNIERTLINAAFCGDMIAGLPNDPSIYLIGGNKAKLKKKQYEVLSFLLGKQKRIIQWDSWRFWETLILGSVPMHVDLEKYGVELPVMPNNWEHYIGIDLDHIKRDVERILDDPESIYKIAGKGKFWAEQNYSPLASAKRLLNLLST